MTLLESLLSSSADAPASAYAWPGGYPLFYLCADGGVLCPVCVNRELRVVLIATIESPGTDKQWEVFGVDVNWEDESLQCDNCNKFIQSAYGDSSEDERIVS